MVYLDSASPDDAREAQELGFVAGITTNPSLIAREEGEPLAVLSRVLEAFPGKVFYQPSAAHAPAAEEEALSARDLAPERLAVKLPARTDFLAVAARLTARGATCGLTAVYSPAQAVAAQAAGCRWLIPYVDRAARLLPPTENVVSALAAVLGPRAATEILAASIKSPAQAVQAVRDGAAALSMPLSVILELAEHELSREAIEEFEQAAASAV